MVSEAYFALCAAFVAAVLGTAVVAVGAPSRWRFIGPAAVLLSVLVAYFGVDGVIGRPKPVGTFPLWGSPALGADGVKVIGGQIAGPNRAFLLVEDGEGQPPRLYDLTLSEGAMKGLKQAMEAHGKASGGKQPWGFVMKAKPAGKGAGGQSLENRDNPLTFAEPQPPAMPTKD